MVVRRLAVGIPPSLWSKADGEGKRHDGQSHSACDALKDDFAIRKEAGKIVANGTKRSKPLKLQNSFVVFQPLISKHGIEQVCIVFESGPC